MYSKSNKQINVCQAQIKIFPELVGKIFSTGHRAEIDNLRFYTICRTAFPDNSGLFPLPALLDVLNNEYGYASLHRAPGNDRAAFLRRIEGKFEQSFLFSRIDRNRFKCHSIRKLIENQNCILFDADILRRENRRLFTDILIGIRAAQDRFNSYQTLSEKTGFSISRLQAACESNHVRQSIFKINNFIVIREPYKSHEAAASEARRLFYQMSLKSRVLFIKKYYWIAIYTANNYQANDAPTKAHTAPSSLMPADDLNDSAPIACRLWYSEADISEYCKQ